MKPRLRTNATQFLSLLITLTLLLTTLAEPLASWAQRLALPGSCQGGAITLVSGDAILTIPNPTITNASNYGCQVSGALRIQLAGNDVGNIPITGRVDAYDAFTSTAIGAFNLQIAGLTLKAITSSFGDEALHITEPRIRIPDSWGGLEATIPKTFTIDTEGMSLISFGLPDIKAKDMTLKLSGALGTFSNGYKITAAGELSLPDIGKTQDCSISVSVTLYVNALGHTVMELETPEPGRSAPLAARALGAAPTIRAAPKARAALAPAAMPLASSYLPLPDDLPEHVLAQLRTEEPAEGVAPAAPTAAAPTAADAATPLLNTSLGAASTPILSASIEAPAPSLEAYLNPFQALPADAGATAGWDGLELTAEAQCGKGIPIGTTGFELTRVYGELVLLPNDQHIALEVTFESSLKVFDLSAVTVDGRTEIGWVPEFAFSLSGTVTLLSMFEVGGAEISVSESDGLRLRAWWNGVFIRGDFAIHAWLTTTRSCAAWNTICYDHYPLDPTCTTTCGGWNTSTKFHFTGSVSCQVGVAKGGLWSGRTIPYPCHCRWCKKWFIYYPCCKWCWVSMYMPPVDLWLAGAEAQFGEFTGDRWGLKGIVSFLGFSLGFYVDHTGDVDFGDVSGYRLVDAQQLRAALAAWRAAVLANGPEAAFAGDDTFTFLPEDKTLVHFNLPMAETYRQPISVQDVITHAQVISQTDTMFSVKANVPLAVSLISPDGVEITPENYDEQPGGYTVAYSQTVTVEDLSAAGPAPDRSRWRFIPTSNVAALRAVDVWLDATQVFTNVSVDDEQLQPYVAVAPGAHTVQVQPAGGGGPALSAPFDVITGTDTTVLLAGYDSPELLVLEDDNSEPDPGAGRVRVVNVASDMGALDVSLDGISYQNVAYGQASSYEIAATGAYSVTVASGLLPPVLGAVYAPETVAGDSGAGAPVPDAEINVIFGDKVAWAGDVNGDGYADALVADNADAGDTGKVTLYLGTGGVPDTTAAWVKAGENAGDKFGIAVAGAGDVNGDGYDDVLIGAYGFDTNRGKAYLYLGSAAGLATEPVWTTLGENPGDLLGGAVAGAGDVNGDGYDDILTGAGGYDESHGKVYLHYGASGGIGVEWTLTGNLNTGRWLPEAARLTDGRVLLAGGDGGECQYLTSAELYDPATGLWTPTGDLNIARAHHTLTRLPDGQALMTGGQNLDSSTLSSTELYNPATGQWTATGSMNVGRYDHTATLLPNGKVLVTGGYAMPSPTASAELYDPATGQWTATGDMAFARYQHTATLLPNGQVLVTGGTYSGSENSAELYNPATGLWTATGSMNFPRRMHTALLLTDGKVLAVGGYSGASTTTSAELYDPATGLWANTGSMNAARQSHTATLLPDGRVLAAGGYGYARASAEVFDPVMGLWTPTSSMNAAHEDHTATPLLDGRVLLAGGEWVDNRTELYDPAARSWSATGENWGDEFGSALASAGDVNGDGYDDVVIGAHGYPYVEMLQGKAYLYAGGAVGLAESPSWTATGATDHDHFGISVSGAGDVNGDGYADVLIGAHGYPGYPSDTWQGAAYLYGGSASGLSADPVWSVTGENSGDRLGNAVSGAGDVDRDGYADFLISAYGYPGGVYQGQVTLYYGSARGVGATGWAPTGSLGAARKGHAAVALADGRVLVVGGQNPTWPYFLASAEVYDPATGHWTPTGDLNGGRSDHTATRLADGRVLVVGGVYGYGNALSSAELYDPATGLWTPTGSLVFARSEHAATLLPNGRVLVVGGEDSGGYLSSAELYDPATGLWATTGSLGTARREHTTTLLPDGRVLVAGGWNGAPLSSAELYNPATGQWTGTGSLGAARASHTATRLPDGRVLVSGGFGISGELASAELYDPATGTWSGTGSLHTARTYHTATALATGQVLAAGGYSTASAYLSSAELWDPATGTWTQTSSLDDAREFHTATALPNGSVLLAGGSDEETILASAEIFTPAKAPWVATGSLGAARMSHAAVALTDGRVLVSGGSPANTSAELYDPATGLWTPTGSLNVGHSDHTATLLADGRVLVAAGQGGSTIAELYDPATGLWTLTGNLNVGRFYHTAIRLFDGRVLVVGGEGAGGVYLASAELYNPATGLWSATGNLNTGRSGHTATLLADGRVLVTGGYGGGDFLSSAEIYDPNTGTWTLTGSFHANQTRDRHAAIRLQDGRVLVIGGEGLGGLLASTELYDPATGTWTLTGSLATARLKPSATLLPDGRVLVAGGKGADWVTLASTELYDPATGMWTGAGNLGAARWLHTATALPGGQVLISGGEGGGAPLASAEIFTPSEAPWVATGAAAGAQFGISVAGGGGGGAIADANGDAHSDLLIGATGAEGGKAFLYYGALGLPATKAPVDNTDVQTLLISRFAGSEDPLSLLQVRDISYEPVTSVMTTTQYIVDQAITGTWTVSLIGHTEVASLTVSAVAAPNPPILDQLTVDASDLENTLVTYRVLSDYRPITMRIFANDGPITETAVITLPTSLSRTAELTRTEVITLFQGIEAATVVISDALAVQNALITTTLDLSFLESGGYRLWVRVEDGVNPPAQGYVWDEATYAMAKLPRAWNRVRIAAEDYDAGKQLSGAALIPIDHTAAWETSWPAVITSTIGAEGLLVTFTPYTHPDVDGYRLEVEEGGVTHVITTGLQVNYRYDELGRPVGEPVHYANFNALSPKRTYSVRIAALDLDHDLAAWSATHSFAVPLGEFTLSAVEPTLELPTGQGVVTATLQLVMSADLFSDVYLMLETLQLPSGITLEGVSYEALSRGAQKFQVPRGESIPAPSRLPSPLRQAALTQQLDADTTLQVHAGIRVAPGVPAASYLLPFIAYSGELQQRVEVTLVVGETPEEPVPPSEALVLEPELPLPSCATALVVTLPSGAFSVPATISFAQNSSNVEDPPQLSFAGFHFTLTAQNAQSQPIQPVKALSLAVTYDPACLGGLRESELHLRRWSDTTGWGTGGVTCTPAPAQNRLNCSLSQLGRFAMFQLPEPDWREIYLPLVLHR